MKNQVSRSLAAIGCMLGLTALIAGTAVPQETKTPADASPQLAGIDLTVPVVTAPSSATRGGTISVVHKTKNIGTTTALTPTSKFYLCTNNVAYAGGFINQQNLGLIAAGSAKTLTNFTYTIPTNAVLGANYIIVVTGFGIIDVDWSNNTNSTTTINIQ